MSSAVQSPRTSYDASNYKRASNGVAHESSNGEERTLEELQQELEATREEKETLAEQYRTLLDRLSEMKSKIGLKLKEDAEELERREQHIQTLTAQNEDLTSTIETLNSELMASNAEQDRVSRELDSLRSKALEDSTQEAYAKERELHELRTELEQCRIERDDWERVAHQERVAVEEARTEASSLRRDVELERQGRERDADELERERERAVNLQSVLDDFQATQERDIRQVKEEYETRLRDVTQSLAEFKSRALIAEVELQESTNSTERVRALEAELKEKTAIVAKLRQEAVTLNEHLMEALRRLRKNTSDTSVDRRLITNILLQFVTTPRADPKRFEMLSLLASILSWSDSEREKAGLQRGGPGSTSSKLKPKDEKFEDTESFSQMWVEFLLKESSQGSGPIPGQPKQSSSYVSSGMSSASISSPTRGTHSLPPSTPPAHGREFRLPSISFSRGNMSTPSIGGARSPNSINPPPLPTTTSRSSNS